MKSELKGRCLLGQYLIWVILLMVQLHTCKCCIEIERKALLELKKYWMITNPESDFDYMLSTWNNDTKSDCCQWQGIMCNHTSQRIIKLSFPSTIFKESSLVNLSLLHPFEEIQSLDLSSGKFNGFVDNVEGYKSLKKLRNLEIMDLSLNDFNNSIFLFLSAATSLTSLSLQSNLMDGPFPFEVCEMKNLEEPDLEGNSFVGQLPLCLGRLNKLRVLDFSSNKLSGNIPSSFNSLESLEYLSLLDNNFTSLFSLHPLANLTKLKVFKLSSTSGMVKVETKSTWKPQFQLSVVVLGSCSLENIPSFFVYQKSLRLLDLSSNKLSGNIPTWLLVNNQELEVLQLQNNAFTIFQMPSTIVHNLRFLDFSANGISGLFPDNIGHALPNLERMNGSHNEFQGHFPSSMGEMVNITYLDLSYNNFSGKLPRSFVNGCISLKQLKLSHNKFSGSFLPEGTSLSSLKELRMDSNSFTGEIGIGLLSSNTTLSVLDMSNNFLVGAIPSWISNLSSLHIFLISNNFLEGTPPPSLMGMSSLSFLDLSRNRFSGALPSHIGGEFFMQVFLHNNNFTGLVPETLESVQILDLRNNKLSGSIPQFVSGQSLKILLLKGNSLTGSIPRQLCDLSNMRLLDLSENKLNGMIPSCLYNLSFGPGGDQNTEVGISSSASVELRFYKSEFVRESFVVESFDFQEVEIKFATKQRYDSYFGASAYSNAVIDYMYGLDLSSNELSGVIPEELGDLSALLVMNLSHNFLSSSIPSSFYNLTDIESLDLSYNNLQGSIPQQLISLTSLGVFDVSHNNLSGMIPQGKQFNTFNENSFIGNPLLCGLPTNRSCEGDKRSEGTDNGRGVEEEEDESAIDMVVFYFSTGSAYVTALIGVLVLMCVDCPWRRAWLRIVDGCIASGKRMLP